MTNAKYYTVVFQTRNLPTTLKEFEPVLGNELIRCHNYMAKITNEQNCYDIWNRQFDSEHPNYPDEDRSDYHGEYCNFIRNKMQKEVVDQMNEDGVSQLLELFIGEELDLEGRVKNTDWEIEFFMKEV